jgi:hypothetical protein
LIFFNLVYYIALFSSVIPLLLNDTLLLRAKNTLFRFVTILTIVKFLSDILVYVLQIKIQNSLPAFHISVLLEFIIILRILNEIYNNKYFKIYLIIGVISCFLDLFVTSNLFENNSFSSCTTFGLIIFNSWKILYSKLNIDRLSLIIIYTFFFYYILAFSFVMFQKIYITDSSVFNFGFIIFALATLNYNLSFSHIIWSLRKN